MSGYSNKKTTSTNNNVLVMVGQVLDYSYQVLFYNRIYCKTWPIFFFFLSTIIFTKSQPKESQSQLSCLKTKKKK